jgi:hypothetical protein
MEQFKIETLMEMILIHQKAKQFDIDRELL